MTVSDVQQFNEHAWAVLLNGSLIVHLGESMLFRPLAEVFIN
jgi:hypothetical protein